MAAFENIQTEYAKEIQSEKDNDCARYDIDHRFILIQKPSEKSGKRTEQNENRGKAQNKADRIFNHSFVILILQGAARKIRNVDGEHRQKTRGDKGYDSFQKRNKILHKWIPPDIVVFSSFILRL